MTAGTAGSPSDGDTLSEVLATYGEDGYRDDVHAVVGGLLRWKACGHEHPAGDVVVDRFRRMEGASDPADMLIVLAVTCPTCGRRGAGVLHFGPTAGEADADTVAAIDLDTGR